MGEDEKRVTTLLVWATLLAGVALLTLIIDFRTTSDLLEAIRGEQAYRRDRDDRGVPRRDVVDEPARPPAAGVPDAVRARPAERSPVDRPEVRGDRDE